MANPQLNSDVYSHLLSFVSSPNDLLSISHANKELMDLTEPELIYRSIRCRLENNATWEHLISNPAHASRVRDLTVEREDDALPRTPNEDDSSWSPPDFDASPEPKINPALLEHTREVMEHSENLLIQALKSMVNLESFSWDRGLQVPLIHEGEDMVHPSTDNGDSAPETYREDIWTVLRDYTQVRRLKVVDLGRYENIFPDSRPIFNSTIFTLRNLSHLDLQLSSNHDPDDAHFGDDADSDDEDLHAAVEVIRLRDLLSHCPNLESLSLDLTKANYNPFSFIYESPFTDITHILSSAHWPQLQSLKLRNIVIRDSTMADFLRAHSNLRMLSASLDLMDDPTEVPFDLEKYEPSIQGILPRLEQVDLEAAALRPLLRAMGRSNSLRSISRLEPCDWVASGRQFDKDDSHVLLLDDVWGSLTEDEPLGSTNILLGLTHLTCLTVENVTMFSQLKKLIMSMPNLEHIVLMGSGIRLDDESPHIQLLSYFSHWPKLVAYEGSRLWPYNHENLQIDSEKALSIARDSIAACPNLREVLWQDGCPVKFVLSEDGNLTLKQNAKFDHISADNYY